MVWCGMVLALEFTVWDCVFLCTCSVTAKGEKRTWSNARGEGSLFSVDLLDQYGSQIRATFFREAVDLFYDLIQKDSVYFMSNGRLKAANKQFTSITNDYEITFDRNSAIQCVCRLLT